MLWRQEIKKICKRRSVLIVVLLFLGLNLVNIAGQTHPTESDNAYFELYRDIEGVMTSERISFVMDHYTAYAAIIEKQGYGNETYNDAYYTGYVFGDMHLFNQHRLEMERTYTYMSLADNVVRQAAVNQKLYRSLGNRYDLRINQIIASTYTGRSLTYYYYTEGFGRYFAYQFSSLLIILLCVYIFTPSFVSEKETAMDQIILSAKKGRRYIVWAKVAAALTIGGGLCLLFYSSDLIGYLLTDKLHGWTMPLYQIREFGLSFLNLSVIQSIILFSGIKTAGIMVVILIVLLCSSLCKEPLSALILASIIIVLLVLSYGQLGFVIGNPVALMNSVSESQSISFMNVFNYPVAEFRVMVAVGLAELIAGFLMIRKLYGRFSFSLKIRKRG